MSCVSCQVCVHNSGAFVSIGAYRQCWVVKGSAAREEVIGKPITVKAGETEEVVHLVHYDVRPVESADQTVPA